MSNHEFGELLVNNSNALRPFAISLTKDNEVAKDLYQETLYRAFTNKDKYHSGTNIKAWLYTIMRNIFINDYRRKAKQKEILNKSVDDVFVNSGSLIATNNAESNFQQKEIRMAVHHLPEIFKTPFLMYFQGYRYNEIAEVLNEPLGTIKSRIHFARKTLKEKISRL
jgi:RNA polymerase sigma-70 factor (ECF subfamily)